MTLLKKTDAKRKSTLFSPSVLFLFVCSVLFRSILFGLFLYLSSFTNRYDGWHLGGTVCVAGGLSYCRCRVTRGAL